MYRYKIYKEQYFNEYGGCNHKYFYVKYLKKYFWGSRWVYLKHKEGGMSGSYMAITQFSSPENATATIKNILCKNKPRDIHITTEIKEINCE